MAYVIEKSSTPKLQYLPQKVQIANREYEFQYFNNNEHFEETRAILNEIIAEGSSYPQEKQLDETAFRDYYLSHDAFVLTEGKTVIGAFYVKPNFPARSAHICNGGFIVKKTERSKGIGTFLASVFPYLARDLGYKASFFNLVYVSNIASVKLWRKLNYKLTGRIPNAGRLKNENGDEHIVDAEQYYFDFSELKETECPLSLHP